MDVPQISADQGFAPFEASPFLAAGPADPGIVCDRAEALARAGQDGRALALLRSLMNDPACPTPLLPRVAAGLSGLGDDASALEASREAARREPGHPGALFSVAISMKRLGYPAELAIPIAERALGLAPDFLPARALLAALLLDAGQAIDAEDLLRDIPACSTPTGGACRIGRMIAHFRLPT